MHSPEEYERTVLQTLSDSKIMLETVKKQLPCLKSERILDVGCGPGNLTASILSDYFPKDSTFIGCDISDTMIKYAERKYGNDKYQFKQLDIEKPNIWIQSNRKSFDVVFSSYCFQWIKDMNQTARNLNELLKNNGQFLTVFLLTNPYLVLFRLIPELDKWKGILKSWRKWDSFQKTSNEKKNEFKRILENNNFEILKCVTEEKIISVNSIDEALLLFDAVNPFKEYLAEDQYQSLLKDCEGYLHSCKLVHVNEKGNCEMKNTLLIVHAKKRGTDFIPQCRNLVEENMVPAFVGKTIN